MTVNIYTLYSKLPATEIENICFHCGQANKILVESAKLEAWRNGAYIQDAFHDLDADDRELIMTGTHPECWNNMFPKNME